MLTSSVFDDFELEYTFPDIGRRVMLPNARNLQAGKHGELLILAMEDVTARKLNDDKVRTAAQSARSLVEASLDTLVTISGDGKITEVNEGSNNATGVPLESLIGTDSSNCFTESERAREGYLEAFSKRFGRPTIDAMTINDPTQPSSAARRDLSEKVFDALSRRAGFSLNRTQQLIHIAIKHGKIIVRE